MRKLSIVALMMGAMVVSWSALSVAQRGGDTQPQEGEADKETHQLPDGYAAVVTKGQRRRIYAIQDSYQDEIDSLQQQIDDLEQKRDREVAQILDDEQKRIVTYILKLRAAERAEEEKAKAATAEPPTPPDADAAAAASAASE